MVRLKSLDLSLNFQTNFDTHPITITHKGLSVDKIDLHITDLNQKETINFQGFSARDNTQKVICKLTYNNAEMDMQSISSFTMYNNKFVDNRTIKNYKDIYFNGDLNINFSKDWFKHNILAGANLNENFVNWRNISVNDQKVFCVGDSYTLGFGVGSDETWPSILDKNACNLGSGGLSHDGCLKNVKFILDNSKYVEKIICLLPPPTRKLFDFEFLGYPGTIPISLSTDHTLPKEFAHEVDAIKNFIVNGNIENDWVQSCLEIIDICDRQGVQCWLSTWGESMHKYIPATNRLPVFPKMNTFKERASDDSHPHKKHYELFVKNIRPYVDKT